MWSRVPIVRILLPLVSGLLISKLISPPSGLESLILIAIPVLTGGVFFRLVYGYRSRWLHGIFVITFVFWCGHYYAAQTIEQRNEVILSVPSEQRTYLVCLDMAPEMRKRSFRSLVSVKSCYDSTGSIPLDAKAMLYFEPDSILKDVSIGSFLLINTRLDIVKTPANPNEFDYREYLARKGIFHSAYLRKNEWKLIKKSSSPSLFMRAEELRLYLLEKLKLNGVSGKYFGISSALLLGEDSHLEADVRDMYARAGAMHILCVSGLHVGVIFLVFNTIFGFLRRFRMGRLILPLLLMSFIWLYALITGLAPPVSRASCMISFFILGGILGRHKNAYNTLAASAFLMIILDPPVIYSAGFQLSYSAVLGIISIQRPLENILYFRYKILNRVWSITTVSIAAQLGTLPVVLYYFHQFPLYSLITNLIVIPLSSLIIYSGIGLLMLPAPSLVSLFTARIFKSLIYIMDAGVKMVESIPYGMAEDIYIDLPMAIFIGAVICCISTYLISKGKAFLFLGLFSILCFSSYRGYTGYLNRVQQAFIVYSVRGHSAYDVIQGNTHHFYADSTLLNSPDKIDYSNRPNWQAKRLIPESIDTILHQMEHVKWTMPNGQCSNIIIWDGKFPDCHPPDTLPSPDFLVLRGKCPFEFEQVFQWFDPGLVIIDSSVPPWVKAPEGDDRFWDVRYSGAYISSECRVPSSE